MIRNLLAGAAVLALMSGTALADGYTSESTTVTSPAPPADSFSKTTTSRSTDAFGNEYERTDSVSKSQAMTPDGASTTVTRSHSTNNNGGPVPVAPMERSTTTTTTTDQ